MARRSPSDNAATDRPLPAARRRARLPLLLISGLLVAAGLFCGGFLSFAGQVATMAPAADARADGIVVLTGGTGRVDEALELLEDGRALRLLISGVSPTTSARQIGRAVDTGDSLFECCVDLDRRATNTIGNAAETARWARHHGFSSLIVVTSAYHMPRSMAELSSAMPEVTLLAYPVIAPGFDASAWWADRTTASLLLEEYLKYIATRARLALDGPTSDGSFLAGMVR